MSKENHSNVGAPIDFGTQRIAGSGLMAERTRAHAWEWTPLGPIATWPDALVILVNALLANQQPSLLFWGEELLQFFNDAAIPIIGPDKFPTALGERGDACWAEVWPLIGDQIEQAYRGEPVWKEDQLVPVYRGGGLEDAWFTYSYSPVHDAQGTIQGVLVTCLETTERVRADGRLGAERTQLAEIFEQAPAFFAVLRGPDHVFERVNPAYQRVIGGLDVVGKPVRDAIPGIAEQGYIDILDRVFRTGEPYIAAGAHFTLPPTTAGAGEERVVDFVYQPLRDAGGAVSGILVLGVDMTERERMTTALFESERRAAIVLDSISDAFHLIDSAGRFQQFNNAARTIYRAHGLDADTLIGQKALELFPAHRESETGRAILACLRDGQPSVLESFYAPWNQWFLLRNYPTPDGGVATLIEDVTEKKRIEAQLREQQERFSFAARAARLGYWFCDLPFDRLIWDTTVKEHFWLPPEADVTIDDFYAMLHPDDREPTRAAIEHSVADHALYDIEYRTIAPDGRFKWIHAIGRTAYADDGTPVRFDGVTQDVTELRQAREALDAERARLAAVFENVPVGLVFALPDGQIASANPQLERILGRSIAQRSFRDVPLFHADGSAIADDERLLGRVFREGGIHRGEFQFRRSDGNMIWVDAMAAPIVDTQGRITGAVGTMTDIDLRKRTEMALMRNEKLALVGRLAASISHEINNPLEAVMNLLYLIENNTSDETIRDFSRNAQAELARVAHVVTHTLRFNRQSLGWSSQRMSDILDSSVAIYEARLRDAGIRLVREYQDATCLRCAPSEIRQVFANLIANAFDAIRRGGELILRARDQRHPRTGNPGVRVSVADSGQGIPPSVRSRLFEPFFTTKGDNGTGLGLWVSHDILNKHGAEIRLRSRTEPGRSGTVFSIWFPAGAPRETADSR